MAPMTIMRSSSSDTLESSLSCRQTQKRYTGTSQHTPARVSALRKLRELESSLSCARTMPCLPTRVSSATSTIKYSRASPPPRPLTASPPPRPLTAVVQALSGASTTRHIRGLCFRLLQLVSPTYSARPVQGPCPRARLWLARRQARLPYRVPQPAARDSGQPDGPDSRVRYRVWARHPGPHAAHPTRHPLTVSVRPVQGPRPLTLSTVPVKWPSLKRP